MADPVSRDDVIAILEGQPRTWALPPEPGPEITAVRDRFGRLWRRATNRPGYWVSELQINDRQWDRLVFSDGPLTEVKGVE